MRIAELARRGGVPVGTVKYYLREGLLPPGTLTSATQAQYDERHVQRLALVRALLGVGGLSIAAAGEVLRAIDDPASSVHELIGIACMALGPSGADVEESARVRARELVDRWGWRVTDDAPALGQLAAALTGVDMVGIADVDAVLDRYAGLMAELAEGDIAEVPTESVAGTVQFVIKATVLLEPLLLAMRRLAHENASVRRFGAAANPSPGSAEPG